MGNPKNHNIVLLRLPFCNVIKFNLRHLRFLLMAMNLVILYTAVILYQSFEKIDSMKRNATKGLTRSEKDQDSFYTSNHWLHEHYHVIDHAFNHADQILFGQSEYNNYKKIPILFTEILTRGKLFSVFSLSLQRNESNI